MRPDGRAADQLRPCEITRRYTDAAPGSVLIRTGRTIVFCTATISDELPPWRAPSGLGWITGEYEMLPGSTGSRKPRSRARVDGRTHEIQRLIGRSLRAVADLAALGPYLITVDCDVLQADGGTRTAAITGGYVALADAVAYGRAQGWWAAGVLTTEVAAVSAGLVGGEPRLDLDYKEDAAAEVDCNLVMTGRGAWVEVQASGEQSTYSDEHLHALVSLGRRGITDRIARQRDVLARPL